MLNYPKETNEKIYRAVFYHYYRAIGTYGEDRVFGVFPYGSMNYGAFYENSDVDTRVVIIPSLKEVCEREKFVNTEEEVEGNKVVYIDIRNFIKQLCNSSPAALEMIFSPFYYINPLYSDFYAQIYSNREEIGRMNTSKLLKACLGQMKSFSSRKQKSVKDIYHCNRLAYFCTELIKGESLEKCFITPKEINQIKYADVFQSEDYEQCLRDAESIVPQVQKYIDSVSVDSEILTKMIDIIYDVLYSTMMKALFKTMGADLSENN